MTNYKKAKTGFTILQFFFTGHCKSRVALLSSTLPVWELAQYLPHLGKAYHYVEEISNEQNFVKK